MSNSSEFGYTGDSNREMGFIGDQAEADEMVNELFTDNGEFLDKSFMSTSYTPLKSSGGNMKVQIEATNKHANIDQVSVYNDAEAEVLVRPVEKFDVVSKGKATDGSWKNKLK